MTTAAERLGRFRDDLQVDAIEKAGGIAYRVIDKGRHVTHEFWELEHTVASLMDGKRSAEEVARACAARGFAVSAEHVRSFHRELKGMGFVVVADGRAPAPSGPADHRLDAQRFIEEAELYRAAGRYELARDLYEAALQLDDSDIDADIGLARCIKMLGGAGAPRARVPELTGLAADIVADIAADASGAPPAKPSAAVSGPATTDLIPDAFDADVVDVVDVADVADVDDVVEVVAVGVPRRRRLLAAAALLVAGGAAAAVLGHLGVIGATTGIDPTTLAPATSSEPPVAVIDVPAVPVAAVAPVAAVIDVPAVPAVVPVVPVAPVDVATPVVPVVPVDVAVPFVPVVAAPVIAPVVDAARPILAQVTSPVPGRFMKVFVKPGARVVKGQKLLQVGTAGRLVIVTAPSAGAFVPTLVLGKAVKQGDEIGNVVDARSWRLTARFPVAPPATASECALIAAGSEVPCSVIEARGAEVVAGVQASAVPWLTADGFSVEKLGVQLRLSSSSSP